MKIYSVNKEFIDIVLDQFPGVTIVQHPKDADIIVCVGSEEKVLKELKKLAPGFLQEYVSEEEELING